MVNAGYTIVKFEVYNLEEDLGIALGYNEKTDQWVTWGCKYIATRGKEPSFFWGHYITDRDAAYKDYHKRLMGEYKSKLLRKKAIANAKED